MCRKSIVLNDLLNKKLGNHDFLCSHVATLRFFVRKPPFLLTTLYRHGFCDTFLEVRHGSAVKKPLVRTVHLNFNLVETVL